MKKGFLLVEVMIATAMASMLGLVLFASWDQINRAAVSADNMVSIFDRMMLLRKQFERDFMGACVPVSRPYTKEKEEEKPAPSPATSNAKSALPAKPEAKEAPKKEKPKPVERVFYAQNQGEMFEMVTFLTNNPLEVYWSDRVGAARPRIARVQYRLEQDPKTEKKPSYTLYRQEAYTLDLDKFKTTTEKSARSYALITGIKELKLTYWQEIQVEQESKKETSEPEKGDAKAAPNVKKITAKETKKEWKKETKKITTWDLDKNRPAKNTFVRPIPTMINVDLVLWDSQRKKSHSFTFLIPILIDIENTEKKKKPGAAEQASSTPEASEAPAAAPTAAQAEPASNASTAAPAKPGAGAASTPIQVNIETDLMIVSSDRSFLLKDLLKDEKGLDEKKT